MPLGCLGTVAIAAITAVAVFWPGLFLVVPFWVVLLRAGRPWAVEYPFPARTLGELALYMTTYGDHLASGYRWTRNEIVTKVRMLVAESMGLSIDDVRPASTFRELGMG